MRRGRRATWSVGLAIPQARRQAGPCVPASNAPLSVRISTLASDKAALIPGDKDGGKKLDSGVGQNGVQILLHKPAV